jgi:Ca2+-binding RTX toxin-like protein
MAASPSSGGNGNDRLLVDDSGDTTANTVNITSGALTGLGMNSGINYGTTENIDLTTGNGIDTIRVRSLASTTRLRINANDGADVLRVGNSGSSTTTPTGTSVMDFADGPIVFNGGAGADLVMGDDSGDLVANSGLLSATSMTGLGMANGVTFSSVSAVTLFTGAGDDTVKNTILATSGIAVTINLGGGENGLEFSGTDGDDDILVHRKDGRLHVVLNGQDSIVEISNCQTIFVHGGKGDDQIVMAASGGERWKAFFFGEDGADLLIGSAKNDQLDGGKGKDTCFGLAGDDLLIGGPGPDLLDGGSGNNTVIPNKK